MGGFAFNLHTTILIILLVIVIILFLTVNRKLSKMIVGSPVFMSRIKEISDILEQRSLETENILKEMKELFESNSAAFEEIKEIITKVADLNARKMENAQKYLADYEESKKTHL